ncbi:MULTISPECIES: YeeE/YedE family protein [unclassified Undibacterium]|uniref:YeeE/YedE family protein n=1 Tax=unclassified Undibacterium TaxID=2630295 RepID=UPI002AC98E71|nr:MULTISPECIES: YeeE/YedE family protein [unclassified Undibacterium]MEB0137610.1 YeeE/YedE family protein [Undibacterium sp. CCC2.1]MEB0170611.1 YeeE/YedE family protein [Undibacterium sp. CCC1.1]MEB0174552.1 YeeE/YedE family protein [Undibacterium sp. CCC3.4]MEB0213651.1 YeeE/YedE family protein [Undibacterium sp. 5I2]WPX43817.1 YeeE/YedE family protein [Undibacterium sp. CCC3.4]
MHIISALIAGIIFGIGLILSGMTNPAKVIGFLDLTGRWDPSLAFVMGGAILVGLFASRWAAGRRQSLTGEVMRVPTATQIDRRLVLGGLSFGIGWGLAGYCPGPALTSLLSGGSKPLVFVAAMIAGMIVFEVLEHLQSRRKPIA